MLRIKMQYSKRDQAKAAGAAGGSPGAERRKSSAHRPRCT